MSNKKPFQDQFDDLMIKMSELIAKTSENELIKKGLIVVKPEPFKVLLEPKNNVDFLKGLLAYTTGNFQAYILQKADLATKLDIEELTKSKFDKVVIPSVIRPANDIIPFNPYILFFTPHGKLVMLPYEGHAFSDKG